MTSEVDLPSGTVTMLFSDVEGSTRLLSRLGDRYTDILHNHRTVLRRTWARWGGHEIGTEGDSFFVVFGVAGDAVHAALDGQRALATQHWPDGEGMQVRMGIHTGEPAVHDNGYVGIDVHRAARVAATAHGGQVVLTDATSAVLRGRLPGSATLVDLGWHRLRDLAGTEHLFQVSAPDLRQQFPPLRSLGTASSLPVAANPLIGRDDELTGLVELIGRPDVRLVTFTGPGGCGKTRLAIAVAHDLVDAYPDGVYFVPLAAASTDDVMCTTIAEVLELPPEARTRAGLLGHVAHRSALLVLDNLEQLPGADRVVSEVLASASHLTVIATARSPLHVNGEREHTVPSLALPDDADMRAAEQTSAVQLFVERATMVNPTFALTLENVADVTEVCRRLDGLPLAIELAAARSKLLSPAGLVRRLDMALEFRDAGVDRPARQRTLRDTLSWSYDLLDVRQQAFFRRLGVCAGGADLDAIVIVTSQAADGDPLDLVNALVDASLARVAASSDGEPRVGMLETVRTFAQDQLRAAGEFDEVHSLHAQHYLKLAERLGSLFVSWAPGAQILEARRVLELELNNFREALRWTLRPVDPTWSSPEHIRVGLRLCAELVWFWRGGGYGAEGTRWLDRAISLAADEDTPDMARCLTGLAELCPRQGDVSRARAAALKGVEMWRRFGDEQQLSRALRTLALADVDLDDAAGARNTCNEALNLATKSGDRVRLASALSDLAMVESGDHHLERSLELYSAAIDIHRDTGTELAVLHDGQNMACVLRQIGRLDDAHRQMWEQIPPLLRFADTNWLTSVAEDYGAVLAELGDHEHAARLLGAADAVRDKNGTPRRPAQEAEIEEPFTKARATVSTQTWGHNYELGRSMTLEAALAEAHAASTP